MIICSDFSDLNIAKMIMIVVIHEPSLYYFYNVSVCRIILLLSHLEVYFFVWEDEVAGLSGVVMIVFIGVVVLVIPSTAAGNVVTGVTGVTALRSGLETDDRSIGEVGRSGAHCWPQAGVADQVLVVLQILNQVRHWAVTGQEITWKRENIILSRLED